MKKAIYLMNALFLAAMVVLDVLLILYPSLLFKSLTSACFAAAAIINLAYAIKCGTKKVFPILMLLGCLFAMAGDIVIYNDEPAWFMAGAALFAVAHILYVIAYFVLFKFHWSDLVISALIFVAAVLIITLAPIFTFGGLLMEIVCIAYALILSTMVGKALADIKYRNALSVWIAIGSVLFFFSDFMLLFNVFSDWESVPRILCLSTYYPAQFMLAFALVVYAEKGASVFKRLYCRTVQTALKLALPLMPYKNPEIIEKSTEVPAALKANGKTHPLLVTDKTVRGLGLTLPLENALKDAGLACTVYDGAVANPTTDNAEEAYRLFVKEGCDSLIGFGGGSPIDCAKCAGALIANPKKSLGKMSGVMKVKKKIPLLIAVPTTAGTGSETTLAAVVVDSKTHHKYAVNDFPLIPSYAVLDETLCASLPQKVVSTTGMDALTHAIEAYIGRGGNAATRKDALDAIKLIFDNLEAAYHGDISARKHMLIASHKAGRAFTRAYVGYVHALAHPLGGKYNVAHGLANAVILPVVLKEYGKAIYKKLWQIALFTGLADENTAYEQGAEAVIQRIEALNRAFGIGNTFSQIQREDIDELASYAEKEANPLYPVPVIWDREKLKEMYEKLRGESEE